MTTSPRTRLAVLLLALAFSGGIILVLIESRPPPPTETVVDNTAAVRDLLDRRAAEGTDSAAPVHRFPLSSPQWQPQPIVREPLDEETAQLFFPGLGGADNVYHPVMVYQRNAHKDGRRKHPNYPGGSFEIRTNSLGMRDDEEPSEEKPDLRILVVGDSQTAGVVPNAESFTNVLEAGLRRARPDRTVEALNAAVGAAHPYTYLGIIEHHLTLEPDLVVMVVFGGNDFGPMMPLQRYFHRRPAYSREPYTPHRLSALRKGWRASIPHELGQLAYFANNPEDVAACIDTLISITAEAQRMCEAAGARLACVYLAPALVTQGRYLSQMRAKALEMLEMDAHDLRLSDRIADKWMAGLGRLEVPVFDLRDAVHEADELVFWRNDLHLDIEGNRIVAEALEPWVRQLVNW